MRETGLRQSAPSYTALSFTDPEALRARLPPGHFSADIRFTLANASAATSHYQWAIRLVAGPRVTLIATGQATVAGGAELEEAKTVSGSCRGGGLKVVVSLAAPAESIDYVASCGG
jgi:hypothetical protein